MNLNFPHLYCRSIARALRRDDGQSLVEVAITMPLLILLLFGAIQLGVAAYHGIEVANAAKAGVAYGTQNGVTAVDQTGIANAAAAEAPDLTLNTTSTSTCVCSDGSASTCLNTDCPTSSIEQVVTVHTAATINSALPFNLFLPIPYTLHASAVQKCLQ